MGNGSCCAARDETNHNLGSDNEKINKDRVYFIKHDDKQVNKGAETPNNAHRTTVPSQLINTLGEVDDRREGNNFLDIDTESVMTSQPSEQETDKLKLLTPQSNRHANQVSSPSGQDASSRTNTEKNKNEPRFLDATPKDQARKESPQKFFKSKNSVKNERTFQDEDTSEVKTKDQKEQKAELVVSQEKAQEEHTEVVHSHAKAENKQADTEVVKAAKTKKKQEVDKKHGRKESDDEGATKTEAKIDQAKSESATHNENHSKTQPENFGNIGSFTKTESSVDTTSLKIETDIKMNFELENNNTQQETTPLKENKEEASTQDNSPSKGESPKATRSGKRNQKLHTVQPQSKPIVQFLPKEDKKPDSPMLLVSKALEEHAELPETIKAGRKFSMPQHEELEELNDIVPDNLDGNFKVDRISLPQEENKTEGSNLIPSNLKIFEGYSHTVDNTPRHTDTFSTGSLPNDTPRSSRGTAKSNNSNDDEETERPARKNRKFRKYPTMKK